MNMQHRQTWAIVLAAGSGSRLASATGGTAKQFLQWQGMPLYWQSALALLHSLVVDGIVFVFPAGQLATEEPRVRALAQQQDNKLPCRAVAGGALRQDSVRLGLAAVPETAAFVLVHDAARPFLTPGLVRRIHAALCEGAEAVIPGLPVTDTIKQTENGLVTATLPRNQLAAVQTPQGFVRASLVRAHTMAREQGLVVTDDATMLEKLGASVRLIPGEPANVKITNPEDLALITPPCQPIPLVGMGYDVHRYGQGRPMKLGGVPVPSAPEVLAHSDGDVLLHALMDALLGAAGLGDIGQHFPDSQAAYAGISSAVLLDQTLDMLREAQISICHVDLTIVAQTPRLSPLRDEIRANVARLLGLEKSQVNLKATTEEKLGFTGRAEGIKAYAVVSAFRQSGQTIPNP